MTTEILPPPEAEIYAEYTSIMPGFFGSVSEDANLVVLIGFWLSRATEIAPRLFHSLQMGNSGAIGVIHASYY